MKQPYPTPAHSEQATRAHVALRDGNALKARTIAKAALSKDSSDHVLRFIFAQALIRTNDAKQALTHLNRIVRDHPENPWYRTELARALDSTGSPEDALAQLDLVLNEDPTHDFAIRTRVKVLRSTGRSTQAWQELAPRLSTLPDSAHIALSLGDILPKDADPDEVIARLRRAANNETVTPPDRRSAFCAVAKILESHGRYTEAFEAATGANELVPPHRLDRHRLIFNQFTPQLINAIEPANLDGSGVVLVCGMPRSGSTLTEQIIGAHPKAASAGEFGGLPIAIDEALKIASRDGIVPAELTTKLAKGYLKSLRAQADSRSATVLIDKLPTNIIVLGLAAKLLPGVRIIRSLRDPRDIAISCYMQDFGERHAYRTKLDALADELLLQQRIAGHWKDQLGDQILESSLEKLIADPEPHARALVAHAGLEWDDTCLNFHQQQAHVRTASTDQIRSGINASGVGRWKNYQTQLAPILDRLQELL